MSLPIFAAETILVLAEQPGDEVRHCGPLIAALCAAGRPPFVVVLTDGPGADPAAADRQVRDGVAGLGLERGRLLLFGISGQLPASGPVFEAAVRAVCFVSWRHDCNVVLAPTAGDGAAVARAAAEASGIGLAEYGASGTRLVLSPRPSARV